MANTDSPFGAKPVRHLNGSSWNGATNVYYVPSTDGTAIFRGDFVKLAGSADADGIPTVTVATTGDAVVGVLISVVPLPTDLTVTYRKAATSMYVNVADSPDTIFEMQENSTAAALAATDVGLNVSYTATTGSTTTGVSAMELDCNTEDTTNTLALQIMRLVQRPDNAIGDYAKWEVRINDHQYCNQITGI